jgi:putative polyhydroxyalkanoate system protein
MVVAVPNIDIVQSHSVTPEEARRRLERFATLLAEKYKLDPTWVSPTRATIERAGAHGTLEIEPTQVRVQLSLPLPLAPLKGKAEERIRRELGYLFADESKYDEAAYDRMYGAS